MPSFSERMLWFRALDYLRQYRPELIGVAGSTGMTVVKGMVSRVLSDRLSVYAPPQAYVDLRGIALGILGQDKLSPSGWVKLISHSFIRELKENEPEAIVLELGAQKPGEIDWLAPKLPLHTAVITNIQTVRTEIFDNRAMLAHEITSLLSVMRPEQTAVLNLDDPLVADMANRTAANILTFGENPAANFCLTRSQRLKTHGYICEVKTNQRSLELHLPYVTAQHHLPFALAALAVAQVHGISPDKAAARLQNYRPPAGYHNLIHGLNHVTVINDSFNASPESMLNSLETLRELAAPRRIAVLSGFPDLGGESLSVHRHLGETAAEVADICLFIGIESKEAQSAALSAGTDAHHFDSAADTGKWITGFLKPRDVLLVCGVRQYQLDQVVKRLAKPEK